MRTHGAWQEGRYMILLPRIIGYTYEPHNNCCIIYLDSGAIMTIQGESIIHSFLQAWKTYQDQ